MVGNFEYYEKDGKQYDRITTILDYFQTPELVAWRLKVGAREAKRISTIAKNIGTNVDEAIRADVNGEKLPKLKTQEAKNCWEGYLQWKKDYSLNVETVNTLFNDELMVAGTPDLYCSNDNTLIDVKCSTEIRDNYWLQTEFYATSRVLNPLEVHYKAILRLNKNLACYEYKRQTLNGFHWDVVRGLILAYRYYKTKS